MVLIQLFPCSATLQMRAFPAQLMFCVTAGEAVGLQQVREVPRWVSGLAEVSQKRPTHSYLCSKQLMARRVGRLKQSAVHGGEGNSKVCLLWTPLLLKNKLSLLHTGHCASPPALSAERDYDLV